MLRNQLRSHSLEDPEIIQWRVSEALCIKESRDKENLQRYINTKQYMIDFNSRTDLDPNPYPSPNPNPFPIPNFNSHSTPLIPPRSKDEILILAPIPTRTKPAYPNPNLQPDYNPNPILNPNQNLNSNQVQTPIWIHTKTLQQTLVTSQISNKSPPLKITSWLD